MRTLLPAAVALLFAATLAAAVVAFISWAGTADVLVPMLREPIFVLMGLASVCYVALSAWIAAALHAGGARRRRGAGVGWLAAAPGLIGFASLLLELAGFAASDTSVGRILAPVLDLVLLAALALPFSAGMIVFAAGFPLAMLLLGAARQLRRLARRRRTHA